MQRAGKANSQHQQTLDWLSRRLLSPRQRYGSDSNYNIACKPALQQWQSD
jgi:hypothetical protein